MPTARERISTSSGLIVGCSSSVSMTSPGPLITTAFIFLSPLSCSFVPKVWNGSPTFPEIVCCHFRLANAGEYSLFVALDAYNPLTGLEIREVPHLLTDKGRKLVDHFMIGFEACDLILFGKHGRCRIMQACDGVSAILGEHDGLPRLHLIPAGQLGTQEGFGDL